MARPINLKAGLTLIELLVVIAVVGLLLGLLFPVIKKSQKQGQMIDCTNNLKQLGISARAYNEDWEILPLSTCCKETKWKQYLAEPKLIKLGYLGFATALLQYHEQPGLYKCRGLGQVKPDISYCYNWLAGSDGTSIDNRGMVKLKLEAVRQPYRFVYMYDLPLVTEGGYKHYRDIDPSDEAEFVDWRGGGNNTGAMWNALGQSRQGSHNGGHCALFGDGHAAWQKQWDRAQMTRSPL